jgi:hypothetical protein
MIAMLIAVFPILSTISLTFHKQIVQKRIEKHGESLLTEQLLIKKSDYPDLLKNKEIEVNGNRYDLIKVTEKEDFWIVTAINDAREKWLEKNMKMSGGSTKYSPAWIYTEMALMPFRLSSTVGVTVEWFQVLQQETIPVHILPHSPPPEIVCVS